MVIAPERPVDLTIIDIIVDTGLTISLEAEHLDQ